MNDDQGEIAIADQIPFFGEHSIVTSRLLKVDSSYFIQGLIQGPWRHGKIILQQILYNSNNQEIKKCSSCRERFE